MVATYSEPSHEQLCATTWLAELLGEPTTLPNHSRDFSQLTGQHSRSRRVGKTIRNPAIFLHFIAKLLVTAPVGKMFFGFPPSKVHHLSIHQHSSQRIREGSLDLFDALNPALASVCPHHHWLSLRH